MGNAVRRDDLLALRWAQLASPYARHLLLAAECAPRTYAARDRLSGHLTG